ncbi:type 4b pilus protein PilO2 [Variovorax ginsengisoli]|uniref:Type 4b pilus protein PilO2 n=1 Tax=Variovorax ginsengisoli TaxID=363844 RepID=A0ABT9SGB0_9BURK|nr:type 4b pilus protein PilO2 [Variovorax ginsengisoli]MDP9902407.1 hypothetical protein [Variovorax ginsengisoli]
MKFRIISAKDGTNFVGNLNWQILQLEGAASKQMRVLASERSATHCVLVQGSEGHRYTAEGNVKTAKLRSIGFLANPESQKVGKKTHSLAAAFALWASDHSAALLHLKTGEDSYSVIGVVNGIPVLDKLEKSPSEAIETAKRFLNGNKDVSVFSDDAVSFKDRIEVDDLFESIASNANKRTLLKKPPANYLAWALTTGVATAAAFGYYSYSDHIKAQKLKEEILRKSAADPKRLYFDLLNSARATAGVSRQSVVSAYSEALKLNVRVGGWIIKRIECDISQGCRASYQRETGTFDSLKTSNLELTLIQTPDFRLNDAAMRWAQKLDFEPLNQDNQMMFGEFAQGFSASQMQDWIDAKLSIQVSPPVLWPQIPGVATNARIPQSIGQGKFEVDSIQLPQALEVITKAPKNIIWIGFQMDIGELKQDAMAQAKIKLTGNYYVQNQ